MALHLAVKARTGHCSDNRPQWKRSRGRPRHPWMQQLEVDTGLATDAAWNTASDRVIWRAQWPIAGQVAQWMNIIAQLSYWCIVAFHITISQYRTVFTRTRQRQSSDADGRRASICWSDGRDVGSFFIGQSLYPLRLDYVLNKYEYNSYFCCAPTVWPMAHYRSQLTRVSWLPHIRRQTEIKMFWESVWNCQWNRLTFSVWWFFWSAAGSKL